MKIELTCCYYLRMKGNRVKQAMHTGYGTAIRNNIIESGFLFWVKLILHDEILWSVAKWEKPHPLLVGHSG